MERIHLPHWNNKSQILDNLKKIKELAEKALEDALEDIEEEIPREDLEKLIVEYLDERIHFPALIDIVINIDGAILTYIVDALLDKVLGEDDDD